MQNYLIMSLRAKCHCEGSVIASEAYRTTCPMNLALDCFVANTPRNDGTLSLRAKRSNLALDCFVANTPRNDGVQD